MVDEARIYGMADDARDPPAAQGLRGENRPQQAAEYAHDVTLVDGRTVTVSQDSGVAFAEATGRAGRRDDETDAAPEGYHWTPLALALSALVVAAAAAAYLIRRRATAPSEPKAIKFEWR